MIKIATGSCHSLVLTLSGSICVFGKNDHRQLGLGDNTEKHQPTIVPGIDLN